MRSTRKTHARLRLAELGIQVIDGGLLKKSGRCSSRGTPDKPSSFTTRSTGIPLRRHLWTACGEMPKDFASVRIPPDRLMTCSTTDMATSQPQVEVMVNFPLVASLNLRFHAYRMSPLGKTVKARLKALNQTQAWLAEKVGVSENAVSKWIKTGEISRENLKLTADALQVSVAQLLDPEPTPELDERWHSFPPSLKQRVLALVDELTGSAKQANETRPQKSKRRAAM